MEKEKIAVGLDIGTTKIVAMIGKKSEYGKLEILGCGTSKSLGVKRGVVNNITQTIQSIKKAVEDAEKTSEYKIKNAVLGIAGQHIRSIQHSDYISRDNSDDVIGQKDIEKLITQVQKLSMMPGEEIIHVLPQEFIIDGEPGIKEPIGMYGSRLEATFHVVVGQSLPIKNAVRCVKEAGLEISGITLEPLASSEAVLGEEEKEAGVALIDIGGGTTDLAIFKDGIIRHTAVVPYGGNAITSDIEEGCSIINRQAEKLKVEYGTAWPDTTPENQLVSIPGIRGQEPKEISLKNLSKIIKARMQEIIEHVYNEIKDYGYSSPNKKLIAGIVLTGGGSELKYIKTLVEYITGLNVRIGYPNEHLTGNSAKEITSPIFATAVGLVLESHKQDSESAISKLEYERELNQILNEKKEAEEEEVAELEKLSKTNKKRKNTVIEPEEKDEDLEIEEKSSTINKIFEMRFLKTFIDKIKDFIDKTE